LEDSPSGIRAALEAGTRCLGVPNEFTVDSVLSSGLLAPEWIACNDEEISAAARRLLVDGESKRATTTTKGE
jgi:beta-phosphoglucomutase-like phosphatase (HAD superfamily)